MNLYESIKSNYEKKEKITKLVEKRKSLKESQKLNEAEVDIDRFAKDLETSLRDNGFKVETNDYRVFTVSAYDRYTVIEIYEADDINNMFEEVASIGIGGDYGDKSIKLIAAPGWEIDTAGGKDVYALFKILSETTPEEVADIILKSYQQTPKDDKLNTNESDNNESTNKEHCKYVVKVVTNKGNVVEKKTFDSEQEADNYINSINTNKYNIRYDEINESEESENKDLDKVRNIANDFVEYLRNNQISAELIDYDAIDYHGPAGKITYGISWGDWKHDHLASEELAKNFFGNNISIDEVVTEEDGSDTYSANHEITFDLNNYSNSQDGDKMSEAEKLKESTKFYNTEEPDAFIEIDNGKVINNSAGKVLDVNTYGLVQVGNTTYVVVSDNDTDSIKVYSVDYQFPYEFKTK